MWEDVLAFFKIQFIYYGTLIMQLLFYVNGCQRVRLLFYVLCPWSYQLYLCPSYSWDQTHVYIVAYQHTKKNLRGLRQQINIQQAIKFRNYLKLIQALDSWRKSETVDVNRKWWLPLLPTQTTGHFTFWLRLSLRLLLSLNFGLSIY